VVAVRKRRRPAGKWTGAEEPSVSLFNNHNPLGNTAFETPGEWLTVFGAAMPIGQMIINPNVLATERQLKIREASVFIFLGWLPSRP
jgi:hypothetical protein